MQTSTVRSIFATALLVTAALAPDAAQAYPQWQFSSGTSRCNQCHFSPSGGGLITNYGRDAAGEDLSTFEGDGGFLHGAVELPTWLALGFDGRSAFLMHDNGSPDDPVRALFPMQLNLLGRVVLPGSLSLSATLGYRGSARAGNDDQLGADNYRPASADRLISREHYLMWRPAALGPYVRAGRFMVPYGLRLAEHTSYVRRDLGNNLLDEGYGVSFGIVRNEWELHVTAYAPDYLREMGTNEMGAAAMFEYRLADSTALGLQARGGKTDDRTRFGGGGYGKIYFAAIKTLLMAEVNVFHQQAESGVGGPQVVAFFGPTIFPAKGLWLSVFGEHSQTDLRVRGSSTEAINGQLNWFPYPHLEMILTGRLQAPRDQGTAKTLLVQLHYYL